MRIFSHSTLFENQCANRLSYTASFVPYAEDANEEAAKPVSHGSVYTQRFFELSSVFSMRPKGKNASAPKREQKAGEGTFGEAYAFKRA